MYLMLIITSVIFFITSLLMVFSLVLSNKIKFNREKASPFECGFDSNSSTRLPFSLRFFLITIIFLIFDVEIVLLLPAIKGFVINSSYYWWLTMALFIMILMVGLVHEWNQGALKWSI